MSNRCDAGTSSRRRNYKKYIKKPEYSSRFERGISSIRKKHYDRDKSGKEYMDFVKDIVENPVVQQMKEYNHHSHTTCFEHSVHVSYYNYLICKKLGWDVKAAAKGGLLHDLFLYDWHGHKPEKGHQERTIGNTTSRRWKDRMIKRRSSSDETSHMQRTTARAWKRSLMPRRRPKRTARRRIRRRT